MKFTAILALLGVVAAQQMPDLILDDEMDLFEDEVEEMATGAFSAKFTKTVGTIPSHLKANINKLQQYVDGIFNQKGIWLFDEKHKNLIPHALRTQTKLIGLDFTNLLQDIQLVGDSLKNNLHSAIRTLGMRAKFEAKNKLTDANDGKIISMSVKKLYGALSYQVEQISKVVKTIVAFQRKIIAIHDSMKSEELREVSQVEALVKAAHADIVKISKQIKATGCGFDESLTSWSKSCKQSRELRKMKNKKESAALNNDKMAMLRHQAHYFHHQQRVIAHMLKENTVGKIHSEKRGDIYDQLRAHKDIGTKVERDALITQLEESVAGLNTFIDAFVKKNTEQKNSLRNKIIWGK